MEETGKPGLVTGGETQPWCAAGTLLVQTGSEPPATALSSTLVMQGGGSSNL